MGWVVVPQSLVFPVLLNPLSLTVDHFPGLRGRGSATFMARREMSTEDEKAVWLTGTQQPVLVHISGVCPSVAHCKPIFSTAQFTEHYSDDN